ncbi:hypothetical protein QGX11_gp124 [Pseudomonas phage PPSC2]|uniref:Uncharacterized protein n=1 Tax=Pseudomonas phage PPSC2 TaxID=2041350 RepID=A0A2R2YAY2_9CAUD|nr:hypothetical protein QGX11_gp124 [Pseudomonas phage PPSC2]ATN92887.1 hypothetical protein PPSC2_124 [Pseudomonas phage PPSC2]
MNTLSFLRGTCRERHLFNIDPNTPDENYSFICTSVNPPSYREWPSTDGKATFRVVGNPYRVATIAGLSGVMGTSYAPNPIILTGVTHTAAPSGELYVRVINWFPANMGGTWQAPEYPLLTITDPGTGAVAFTVSSVWDKRLRPTTIAYKVVYTDRNGDVQSVQTPFLPQVESTWVDVKVFIPVDGPLQLVVSNYTQNGKVLYNETQPTGKGFRDKTGQIVSLFTPDGVTPTDSAAKIYRVGIGNKLTTARP